MSTIKIVIVLESTLESLGCPWRGWLHLVLILLFILLGFAVLFCFVVLDALHVPVCSACSV